MTKRISKYSNLYDVDGNLLQKAPRRNWTIAETEALLNNLVQKVKDNPDNKVYKVYLNNTYKTLMWMYSRYGNPHEKELIAAIKQYETNKLNGEYEQQADTRES